MGRRRLLMETTGQGKLLVEQNWWSEIGEVKCA
ncbi:hypothetical protein COLU111180_16320 [Cohnella lubricantis]|nr:hypothetical protein [Cohnella lubricantis]